MNEPEQPLEEEEFDLEEDRVHLERKMARAIAAGIAVALAGIALAIWVFFVWSRADDAAAKAEMNEVGLDAVSAGLDTLREQVKALGATPLVPPAEELAEDAQEGNIVLVPGPRGEQGIPGPGPTPEEVQSAVDFHCSRQPGGTCEGAQGIPGEVGATGTGVIGASIVDCHLIFVFSNGTSTDAGNVCGPVGVPTDEQVQIAVDNFCLSHDNCQGPMGPQGEQGIPGPACPEGFTSMEVTIPSAQGLVFSICARPV